MSRVRGSGAYKALSMAQSLGSIKGKLHGLLGFKLTLFSDYKLTVSGFAPSARDASNAG